MSTVVQYDPSGRSGYSPRGGAAQLWRYKGPEVMLSGPSETGKTTACLHKLHAFLCKYPRAQGVLVRKVRDTIFSSVLQTFVNKVLPPGHNVAAYGGGRPSWYDYPNGSRLWLAGMDDPEKVLSSERDVVYVNQAEELTLDDWQTLSTRTTGRAGNAPYGQLMGDCNPGPPHHWIKHRPTLRLIESRHEDNPTLHDGTGWTEQGRHTLAVLDALTGVRRERLRFGRWAGAEGQVYDFDAAVHLVEPFTVPSSWPRLRSFDFGYTNPFVCQWWAQDPDGRLYLYRELYMTGRTVNAHAEQINELSAGEGYQASVADHDAEGRATLAECGIHTTAADKAVSVGVQAVQTRLQRAGDGRPRLFLFRGCLVERDEALASRRVPVCTEQEFDAYVWAKGADGRPNKEVPVDLHDHGLDALRYAVMWADGTPPGVYEIGYAQGEDASPFSRAPKGVF